MNKTILYLITKSHWGGAQRYVYDLATSAKSVGFPVAVASGDGGELIDRLREEGVRTHMLPSLARDIGFMKDAKAFFEIIACIKKEKPDVIHLNSSKAGILGAFAGRIMRVRHIIFTAHGWAFNEDRPYHQKILIKIVHWLTILLSHKTIVVSHEVKKHMDWPFTHSKMVVIHNGRASPHLFSHEIARAMLVAQYPELQPYRDDPWSVTIAELHKNKQHDAMIRAMRLVVENEPNARHVIMGGGELEKELTRMIQEHNLSEHVFLLGAVPDAANYLQAFSFLILPSRTEALPYVPIEACFAGIPTIASRVGGIPEIIRHDQEGFLVPSGNENELAKAYRTLLRDDEKRSVLSKNALLRAQHFSLEHMLKKTFEVYGTR